MSMLHTMQSSYQRMRKFFITSDDNSLPSYKSSDRPEDVFECGPEVGGVGIIFIGDGVENDTFSWSIYGYRACGLDGVGPGEFICSGTGLLGTAVSEVASLYADTITITDPGSWLDVPIAIDVGNNRICKVCFDLCGYKYIYVMFTGVGGGGVEVDSINAYLGFF